jgi:hypothetical protein
MRVKLLEGYLVTVCMVGKQDNCEASQLRQMLLWSVKRPKLACDCYRVTPSDLGCFMRFRLDICRLLRPTLLLDCMHISNSCIIIKPGCTTTRQSQWDRRRKIRLGQGMFHACG